MATLVYLFEAVAGAPIEAKEACVIPSYVVNPRGPLQERHC